MTDTKSMQATDPDHAGSPAHDDGVEQPAGKSDSESNGGAYPNPHTGKSRRDNVGGGFLGHGGQSGMDYSGTGDGDTDETVGNDNAVTR